MEGHLLRTNDVLKQTSLSKATLYRMLGRGHFPVPVRLGGKTIGWWSHEVEAWLEGLPRSEGREIMKRNAGDL